MINFIATESDNYAEDLDPTVSDAMKGRATRGAFLALKARALLYLASPLNNASNSKERWEDAAKAAQAVMTLGVYHLYRNGEYAYGSLFFDKSNANTEIIFERRFQFPEITHNIHMQWSTPHKAHRHPAGNAFQSSGFHPLHRLHIVRLLH